MALVENIDVSAFQVKGAHVDIADAGGIYGDSSSTARQQNSVAVAKLAAKQAGNLRMEVNGELHLAAGNGTGTTVTPYGGLAVGSVSIVGKGTMHVYGGYQFFIGTDGQSYHAGVNVVGHASEVAGVTDSFIYSTTRGANTRPRSMMAELFTSTGRVVMIRPLVDATFPSDPTSVTYGPDAVVVQNFTASGFGNGGVVDMNNSPYRLVVVQNGNLSNFVDAAVWDATDNTHPYERQMQAAKVNLQLHGIHTECSDTWFGDGVNTYHAVLVTEGDTASVSNCTTKGLKVRVSGNVVYDFYYHCRRVTESSTVTEDCMAFNDARVTPLKVKGANQYQVSDKKWLYRRNYVAEMQAANPGVTVAATTGDFISIETEDWHVGPTNDPRIWGARSIDVSNVQLELLSLGDFTRPNRPAYSISITGSEFTTLATGRLNFINLATYPHNIYQTLRFDDNNVQAPAATLTGVIQMLAGTGTGGGTYTGTISISRNRLRIASGNLFSPYSTVPSEYSNASVYIQGNTVTGVTGVVRTLAVDAQPSKYDEVYMQGNTLRALTTSVNCGYMVNGANAVYGSATLLPATSTNCTVFAIANVLNAPVQAGTYMLQVSGNAGVVSVNTLVVSTSAAGTAVQYTNSTGASSSISTASPSSASVQVAAGAGHALTIASTSSSIVVATTGTVAQRYEVSVWKLQ